MSANEPDFFVVEVTDERNRGRRHTKSRSWQGTALARTLHSPRSMPRGSGEPVMEAPRQRQAVDLTEWTTIAQPLALEYRTEPSPVRPAHLQRPADTTGRRRMRSLAAVAHPQ